MVISNDLALELISANGYYRLAATQLSPILAAGTDEQVDVALRLICTASRPVMYVGVGVAGAADTVMTLAKKLQSSVITTALGKPIISYAFEALLGLALRVASKPANEACWVADLMLFVGSNYPLLEVLFLGVAKFI